MSQRAIKWVLLLLLLSGCTKAEERCKAINIQRILAHARELGDERIAREIADSAGPGFDLEKDNAIRRRLRARNTEPFNRDWQQKYPHDSTLWHHPAKDSAEPDPQPPPRPSDVAWYNEHCWEGKAR